MPKYIDPVQAIPAIQRINGINQLETIKSIDRIRPIYSSNKQTMSDGLQDMSDTVTSTLANYNDPLEINSLADAIANTDAKVAKYGKWAKYMPIVSTLVALADHSFNHYVKPLFTGKPQHALINALQDFGETMDITAQPFKALSSLAGGGKEAFKENLKHGGAAGFAGTIGGIVGGLLGAFAGPAGIAAGATLGATAGTWSGAVFQGFFTDEDNLIGRKNYDYDTGNLGADIALELVSDPLNLLSIGGGIASAAKAGIRTAGTKTAKSAVKAAVKETVADATTSLTKKQGKQLYKTIKTGINKAADNSIIDSTVPTLKTVLDDIRVKPFSETTLKELENIKVLNMSPAEKSLYQMTGRVQETLDAFNNGIQIQRKLYTNPIDQFKSDANLYLKTFMPNSTKFKGLAGKLTPDDSKLLFIKNRRIGGIDSYQRAFLKGILAENPLGLAADVANLPYVKSNIQYGYLQRILKTAEKNHWATEDTHRFLLKNIGKLYDELATEGARLKVIKSVINNAGSETDSETMLRIIFNRALEDAKKSVDELGNLVPGALKSEKGFKAYIEQVNKVIKEIDPNFDLQNNPDLSILQLRITSKLLDNGANAAQIAELEYKIFSSVSTVVNQGAKVQNDFKRIIEIQKKLEKLSRDKEALNIRKRAIASLKRDLKKMYDKSLENTSLTEAQKNVNKKRYRRMLAILNGKSTNDPGLEYYINVTLNEKIERIFSNIKQRQEKLEKDLARLNDNKKAYYAAMDDSIKVHYTDADGKEHIVSLRQFQIEPRDTSRPMMPYIEDLNKLKDSYIIDGHESLSAIAEIERNNLIEIIIKENVNLQDLEKLVNIEDIKKAINVEKLEDFLDFEDFDGFEESIKILKDYVDPKNLKDFKELTASIDYAELESLVNEAEEILNRVKAFNERLDKIMSFIEDNMEASSTDFLNSLKLENSAGLLNRLTKIDETLQFLQKNNLNELSNETMINLLDDIDNVLRILYTSPNKDVDFLQEFIEQLELFRKEELQKLIFIQKENIKQLTENVTIRAVAADKASLTWSYIDAYSKLVTILKEKGGLIEILKDALDATSEETNLAAWQTYKELYTQLNDFVNSVDATQQLLTNIFGTDVLGDFKGYTWSALQKLWNVAPSELAAWDINSREMQELFSSIEIFNRSNNINRRLTLTNIMEEYGLELDTAHIALADARGNYALVQKMIDNKELVIPKDMYAVTYDTETLGLSQNDRIRELAFVWGEGSDKEYHAFIELPKRDFENVKKADGEVWRQMKLAYEEQTGNALTTVEQWNKIAVPEEKAYNELYAKVFNGNEDKIILTGHNIQNFDNMVIENNIKQILDIKGQISVNSNLVALRRIFASNSNIIKNCKDTYQIASQKALSEAGRVSALSLQQKEYIYAILRAYAAFLEDAKISRVLNLNKTDIITAVRKAKELSKLDALQNKTLEQILTGTCTALQDVRTSNIKAFYAFQENNQDLLFTFVDDKGVEHSFTNFNAAVTTFSTTKLGPAFTSINVYDNALMARFFDADALNNLSGNFDTLTRVYRTARHIAEKRDRLIYTRFLDNDHYKGLLIKLYNYVLGIDEVQYLKARHYFKKIPDISKALSESEKAEILAKITDVADFYATTIYLVELGAHNSGKSFKKALEDIFEGAFGQKDSELYRLYSRGETQKDTFVFLTEEDDALKNWEKAVTNAKNSSENAAERLDNFAGSVSDTGLDRPVKQRALQKSAKTKLYNERLAEIQKEVLFFSKERRTQIAKETKDVVQDNQNLLLKHLETFNEEQMYSFLLDQHRFIIMQTSAISDTLKQNLDSFKHITLKSEPTTGLTYIVLNKSYDVPYNMKTGYAKHTEYALPDFKLYQDGYTESEYAQYVTELNELFTEITGVDSKVTSIPVQTMENYKKLYATLPEDVKDALPAFEDLCDISRSDWNNFYNFNIIGAPELWDYLGHPITDYVKSQSYIINNVLNNATTAMELEDIIDDGALGLTWAKGTDNLFEIDFEKDVESIMRFLTDHPEYNVFMHVKDKHGDKVIPIVPLGQTPSKKVLLKAYNTGASLTMQTRTAGNVIMDTLNWKNNNTYFRIARSIVKLFKAGYLASVGTIMRNMIDSYLKNVAELGSVDATRNTFKAVRLYKEWQDCYHDIIKVSQFKITDKNWYVKTVDYYFNNQYTGGLIDKDLFMSLSDFFENGPSSAMLEDLELQKRVAPLYKKAKGDTNKLAEIKDWYDGRKPADIKQGIDAYEDFTNKVMLFATAPNSYVERVNRLAMFLSYSEQGVLTRSQIYDKIARTHFDFAYKSNFERYMELIIPFYSFTKDNLTFWLNLAEANPSFIWKLSQAMIPVSDFDEYSYAELEANRSLQNKIMTGQITIMPNANLTIKTSPSFLDALMLFTDPREAITQRLVSPVKFASEYTEDNEKTLSHYLNLLPVVGSAYVKAEMIKRNQERITNSTATPTQKLAARPLGAVSSLFGTTLRYDVAKYNSNNYYKNHSREYYNNNQPQKYTQGTSYYRRPKRTYYPLEAPTRYSSPEYRFIYLKSMQRYLNR